MVIFTTRIFCYPEQMKFLLLGNTEASQSNGLWVLGTRHGWSHDYIFKTWFMFGGK